MYINAQERVPCIKVLSCFEQDIHRYIVFHTYHSPLTLIAEILLTEDEKVHFSNGIDQESYDSLQLTGPKVPLYMEPFKCVTYQYHQCTINMMILNTNNRY